MSRKRQHKAKTSEKKRSQNIWNAKVSFCFVSYDLRFSFTRSTRILSITKCTHDLYFGAREKERVDAHLVFADEKAYMRIVYYFETNYLIKIRNVDAFYVA